MKRKRKKKRQQQQRKKCNKGKAQINKRENKCNDNIQKNIPELVL